MLFIFQDVSTVGGDREEEVFVIYFPVVSLTIFQDISSTALKFLIHTSVTPVSVTIVSVTPVSPMLSHLPR